jgi:hypothetical protein
LFNVQSGWLGYPLFRDRVVELDYGAQVIRWHDRKDFLPPDGVITLSIVTLTSGSRNAPQGISGKLMVRGKMNGVEGVFILDTASNGMISPTEALMNRTGLAGQTPYLTGKVVGSDGGVVEKKFYQGVTLQIGSERIGPLVAGVIPQSVLGEDGIVGWGVLHAFRWWFDGAQGVVYALPRKGFEVTQTPLAWLYEGEHLQQQGQVEGAILAWRKTLIFNPADLVQRYRVIEALGRLGRTEEALKEVDETAKIHSGNPSVQTALARYRQWLGVIPQLPMQIYPPPHPSPTRGEGEPPNN